MKEKLLLVGAGGFGRVVSEHARKTYDCAFIDDGSEIGTDVCGLTIVGKTEDLEKLYGVYRLLIVTIGNNKLRERIYQEASKIGYTFPNIICGTVYISPYAEIGKGCVFLNNVTIQNGAHVGDGVILMPNIEIHHDASIGRNVLIYANTVIRSLASIGDRAWVGSTLSISNGVSVPEDAVVPNGRTLL